MTSKADEDATRTATWSVMSCLVEELTKSGAIDFGSLIERIQVTSIGHQKSGNPQTAQVMYLLSEYLQKTVPQS
ncbi:hypothetical protein ASF70_15770 [Rhizobium sp. Leaf321]|uniref:hypothetical protein n=1 Tax=Rhizobium sp. Leaf321 TaxID=1736335 RepID=UPI00071531E6|nr:hypothetical protein [Rhizobium sp. Leaf321]KQQ72928.1 hypothetical protein ASF70_15770 [Rhizobium sp. Leaf321]